jgi:hypothetical protein
MPRYFKKSLHFMFYQNCVYLSIYILSREWPMPCPFQLPGFCHPKIWRRLTIKASLCNSVLLPPPIWRNVWIVDVLLCRNLHWPFTVIASTYGISLFFWGGGGVKNTTVSVVALIISRKSNMQPLITPNRKHNQKYITVLTNGLILNWWSVSPNTCIRLSIYTTLCHDC